MAHNQFMSKGMDEIEEKLKKFVQKDLALRKAIAKRQERIDARQKMLRVVGQAIGVEPNQRCGGQEYQPSGHQNGHQMS